MYVADFIQVIMPRKFCLDKSYDKLRVYKNTIEENNINGNLAPNFHPEHRQ